AVLSQSMIETVREATNINLSRRDAAMLVAKPEEVEGRLRAKLNHKMSPGVERKAALLIADWHSRLIDPLKEKTEARIALNRVADQAYESSRGSMYDGMRVLASDAKWTNSTGS